MSNLSDPVPISSIPSLNKGLTSASEATMIAMLGRPREPLTTDCRNDQASPLVSRLMETRRMTGNFGLTGIKPALDSAEAALTQVKNRHPDLIEELRTEGMLCVRHRKPTSGAASLLISNHSWGTAVDFRLNGSEAPGNTGSNVPRWLAILIPFLNRAGWYSGVGFTACDAMHFEVAEETIRRWHHDGLLEAPQPETPIVVADQNAGAHAPSAGDAAPKALLKPFTEFFSRLFGSA